MKTDLAVFQSGKDTELGNFEKECSKENFGVIFLVELLFS